MSPPPIGPGPRYVGRDGDVDSTVTPLTARLGGDPATQGPAPASGVPAAGPHAHLVALPDNAVAEVPERPLPAAATVAWNELMRAHGRRVVVSLVARGIPMERAQELAQEAWLRIISQHRAGRLDRLDMPGIVVAQANFLARDEHRRRSRRVAMGLTSPDVPGHEIADLADAMTGPDLERRVGARQSLRRVLEVVDRAYPNAQRVFHLLYGADPKTPVEVAARTGLSVQRVRQILCELRRAIRTELQGSPISQGGPQ